VKFRTKAVFAPPAQAASPVYGDFSLMFQISWKW
jgi:hypothetical protein